MTDMVDNSTHSERPALTLSHEAQVQRATLTASGVASGAWGEFLRKVLPPITPQPTMRLVRIAQA